MRSHRPGHVAQGPERCEVGAEQFIRRGGHAWQFHMAVGRRTAMAGHMFDDGNDAAIKEAFAGGAAQGSDNAGSSL